MHDLTGRTFGRLTARLYLGGSMWKFSCSCGQDYTAQSDNVRRGLTKSCGCYRRERATSLASKIMHKNTLRYGESSFRRLCSIYRKRAISAGRDFLLSSDFCMSLFTAPCSYCGQPPSNVIRGNSKNGDFTYSGIDRTDNSVGYTEGNCVSCCALCNRTKGAMELSVFMAWIKGVATYYASRN